jgi:hypothetical protein
MITMTALIMMAQELRMSRDSLEELLTAATLPPDARLLMIGFAVRKAEYLHQRAYQLFHLSLNI